MKHKKHKAVPIVHKKSESATVHRQPPKDRQYQHHKKQHAPSRSQQAAPAAASARPAHASRQHQQRQLAEAGPGAACTDPGNQRPPMVHKQGLKRPRGLSGSQQLAAGSDAMVSDKVKRFS